MTSTSGSTSTLITSGAPTPNSSGNVLQRKSINSGPFFRVRHWLLSWVSLLVKRKLRNTYVLPIVIYLAPVWDYAAATNRKKLQSVLNLKQAAKISCRFSFQLLRRELGVRPFEAFEVTTTQVLCNPLIAGLGNYCPEPGNSWKWPRLLAPVEFMNHRSLKQHRLIYTHDNRPSGRGTGGDSKHWKS